MSDGKDDDSKYYSMGKATDDIKHSYGAAEVAGASVKLVAKGIFNLGRFALTEVPGKMIETMERKKNK